MKLYFSGSVNPYFNLALEEWLYRSPGAWFNGIFMLWQNEPSVVFGQNQNPYAELDVARAEALGVHLVRRITGGGAVYHDLGNINYTYIVPRAWADPLDYAYFEKPLAAALASFGLRVESNGRNDLLVDGSKKISGVAQTADNRAILHHGTILYDADLTRLAGLLTPSPEKLKRNNIASVSARVANIRPFLQAGAQTEAPTTREFLNLLANKIALQFGENFESISREMTEQVLQSEYYQRNIDKDYIKEGVKR